MMMDDHEENMLCSVFRQNGQSSYLFFNHFSIKMSGKQVSQLHKYEYEAFVSKNLFQ